MKDRPQVLRFYADEENRDLIFEATYDHPTWPPPEVMLLLLDHSDAREPAVTPLEHWDRLLAEGVEIPANIEALGFRRTDYSKLTDEQLAEWDFVTRGAKYVVDPSVYRRGDGKEEG